MSEAIESRAISGAAGASEVAGAAQVAGASSERPAATVDVVRSHYKTREVVELLDLSRRQLQYWAKTGLIEPSARTPGGHHRYSFDDLVALKATRRLIDAGVSVQKIRKSVRALQELLPQVGRPLSELVLVATGDVVLVFRDDTVFEALSGQEWVFEVAQFEREVSDYRLTGKRLTGKRLTGKHETGKHRAEARGTGQETNGSAQSEPATAETRTMQEDRNALPPKPGPRGARSVDRGLRRSG